MWASLFWSTWPYRGGALRGSGLYNACIVGRVVLGHHPPTRPSLAPSSTLRGTSGGATMTYRSPGRLWFPILPRLGLFLCTLGSTKLPNLYIRNIIPGDMGIPFWNTWPYRGGAMRYSPECVEWGFSEVRTHGVLRSSALSWCSEVFCAMAHIHSPKTGVGCPC
jgi:hypothetical protein